MLLVSLILLVSGYDVLPIDFKDVPLQLAHDATKLRNDAWRFAIENEGVTTLTGGQQTRGVRYKNIQMVYELGGGNVLSQENFKSIQKFENEIFTVKDYQNELCHLHGTGKRSCKNPLSILRFFDGTHRNISPSFYDPHFNNITNVLHTAMRINLTRAILTYHLGKDAMISQGKAKSTVTRSLLYTGWPLEGYNSTNDRKNYQVKDVDRKIVDIFASRLNRQYGNGVGKMNFFYDNPALNKDALEKQVYDLYHSLIN